MSKLQKTFVANTAEELDQQVNEFSKTNNVTASQMRVMMHGESIVFVETAWYDELGAKPSYKKQMNEAFGKSAGTDNVSGDYKGTLNAVAKEIKPTKNPDVFMRGFQLEGKDKWYTLFGAREALETLEKGLKVSFAIEKKGQYENVKGFRIED